MPRVRHCGPHRDGTQTRNATLHYTYTTYMMCLCITPCIFTVSLYLLEKNYYAATVRHTRKQPSFPICIKYTMCIINYDDFVLFYFLSSTSIYVTRHTHTHTPFYSYYRPAGQRVGRHQVTSPQAGEQGSSIQRGKYYYFYCHLDLQQ